MVRILLRGMAMGLIALAVACGALLAQNRNTDSHPKQPSNKLIAPYVDTDTGLVPIFSNLGPTTTNLYNATFGYCVTGNSQFSCGSTEQWMAQPFTPRANSHVETIAASLQYLGGTNKVVLALYNDVGGAPGTALASQEVGNVPAAGTCCRMVGVNFGAPGVAVTGGTQYWVVASADDTSAATFAGYWGVTNSFLAFNPSQTGWLTFNDTQGQEATVVKGTVP